MSGFIQIGVTAMRDPVTSEFLPEVPLYVEAEHRERVAETMDEDLRQLFAGKMAQYRKETARAKG